MNLFYVIEMHLKNNGVNTGNLISNFKKLYFFLITFNQSLLFIYKNINCSTILNDNYNFFSTISIKLVEFN